MIRYWLFGALLGAATVLFAQIAVPPTTKTLTITGMCEDTTWKAYRTKSNDLWVGCGSATPPDKSVELRAYYPSPINAGPKR